MLSAWWSESLSNERLRGSQACCYVGQVEASGVESGWHDAEAMGHSLAVQGAQAGQPCRKQSSRGRLHHVKWDKRLWQENAFVPSVVWPN